MDAIRENIAIGFSASGEQQKLFLPMLGAGMDLPRNPETRAASISRGEAQRIIRTRLPELASEWHEAHPKPFEVLPDRVTVFEDYGLRRLPNGEVELYGPDGMGGEICTAAPTINSLGQWLYDMSMVKLRLLAFEDLGHLIGLANLLENHYQELEYQVHLNASRLLKGNAERRVVTQMTDFLDQEAWRLSRYAQGADASFEAYNIIVKDLPAWLDLEKQTLGLLPLVHQACRLNYIDFDANVLRSLKRYLSQFGMSAAGWRTLCRMPITQVSWMVKKLSFLKTAEVVNHFARVGMVPPNALFCMSVNSGVFWAGDSYIVPEWFDAAAIRECNRQKEQYGVAGTDFVKTEYMIAADWVLHYIHSGQVPDKQQRRAGWQWIKHQSDAWHEAQVNRCTTDNYTWVSELGSYADGEYQVVALTSVADLEIEGRKMHHCVGGYAPGCRDGHSRIFSIRKGDASVATVELFIFGNHWQIRQVRGPCNSDPGPEIKEVARRLMQRYHNAVWDNASKAMHTQRNVTNNQNPGLRQFIRMPAKFIFGRNKELLECLCSISRMGKALFQRISM